MLHILSTLVLVILAVGIYCRRQRERHIKLMATAFVIDVGLVLYIELTRHAVEAVVSGSKVLVWTHAAISLTVLVLYVAQIALGYRLLTGQANLAAATGGGTAIALPHTGHHRALHRNLGMAFVVFRLLNYGTAFLL